MMRRNLLLLLFISSGTPLWAQVAAPELQAFNTVYQKTFLETSQNDFPKALHVADSLYTASATPLLKARSLMLSASLYQQTGDIRKSVNFALEAKNLLNETEEYFWKSKIQGFLATQYRFLRLYHKSRQFSTTALAEAKQIPDPEQRSCNLGLILQEQAYLAADRGKYRDAIGVLAKAEHYFLKVEANRNHFLAGNEQLLGKNYLLLKDIPQARHHYQKALELTKNQPTNFLTGLIYNGLVEVSLADNDLKKAGDYLKKAEQIANESEYLELKNEFYKTSELYYARLKNVPAMEEVRLKKDTVSEKIDSAATSFLDETYAQLEQKQTTSEKQSRAKDYMIGGISILLAAGIFIIFIYKRRNRKLLERFREVMAKLEAGTTQNGAVGRVQTLVSQEEQKPQKLKADDKTSMMTPETEERLLEHLEAFEKNDAFTQSTISLTDLASSFGTNTKYLSYIINTYRKKDFKNYINELRVRYIIGKLKKEPVYRRYKIAVLAEEAGFSSQAKFSTIFKNETSFSPSQFIHFLTEEEERMIAGNS